MRTLVAFGIGANFYSYMERLDSICNIEAFSDNNSSKWGQYLLGDDRVCISPGEISAFENPLVVIMSDKESSIQAIEKQCDSLGYKHIRVIELLEKVELQYIECNWPQKIQRKRIHKFIELLVFGTTECNFHCEYCYVWRKEEFHKGTETSFYPVIECRKALSQQKLGGVCHINICASGETMLSKDIVELMKEMYQFIADFDDEVPGASAKDCGNYLDMNLPMARYVSKKYLEEVLLNITDKQLIYPE